MLVVPIFDDRGICQSSYALSVRWPLCPYRQDWGLSAQRIWERITIDEAVNLLGRLATFQAKQEDH